MKQKTIERSQVDTFDPNVLRRHSIWRLIQAKPMRRFNAVWELTNIILMRINGNQIKRWKKREKKLFPISKGLTLFAIRNVFDRETLFFCLFYLVRIWDKLPFCVDFNCFIIVELCARWVKRCRARVTWIE